MKLPHGMVYAILIIVGILAVTIYAKLQGASISAGTTVTAQPPEPAADEAPPVAPPAAKSDAGVKAEGEKDTEEPSS